MCLLNCKLFISCTTVIGITTTVLSVPIVQILLLQHLASCVRIVVLLHIIRMICNHKITALAQSEEDKMIVLNLIRDKWNRITGI